MDIVEYKELIEDKLDIKGTLLIQDDKIIPNKALLTKRYIKDSCLDDLFKYHVNNKVYMTNRLMSFVGDITDRQVLTDRYYMELRVYIGV